MFQCDLGEVKTFFIDVLWYKEVYPQRKLSNLNIFERYVQQELPITPSSKFPMFLNLLMHNAFEIANPSSRHVVCYEWVYSSAQLTNKSFVVSWKSLHWKIPTWGIWILVEGCNSILRRIRRTEMFLFPMLMCNFFSQACQFHRDILILWTCTWEDQKVWKICFKSCFSFQWFFEKKKPEYLVNSLYC